MYDLHVFQQPERHGVDGLGVFDLRNMANARQRHDHRVRQQRLENASLHQRCHRILFAPQDSSLAWQFFQHSENNLRSPDMRKPTSGRNKPC